MDMWLGVAVVIATLLSRDSRAAQRIEVPDHVGDSYFGCPSVGQPAESCLGPVLAVLVTRQVDGKREQRTRRMEVFRSLMAARRTPISPERVKALTPFSLIMNRIWPRE